jgi:hypothetical protein
MTYSEMIAGTSGLVGYWKMGETGSGTVSEGAASVAIPDMADDFERTNGAAGVSTSRHPWVVTGTTIAAIVSGRLECPGNGSSYSWVDLGAVPTRMSGVFSLNGAGGSAGVALVNGPQPDIKTVVHFQATRNSWTLMVSADFGTLGGTTIASGSYSVLATNGTTTYNVAMTLSGDLATLELPDGTTTTCRDYRIAAFAGRFGCWEIGRDASTSARWESVAATSASRAPFHGIFGSGVTHGQTALISADAALSTLFHGSSGSDDWYGNPYTTGTYPLYWPGSTGDWTFEVWFKTTSAGFFRQMKVTPTLGTELLIQWNGGQPSISSDTDTGFSGPAGLNDGAVHHLAIVRTQSALNTMYVDGVSSWSGVASAASILTGTLRISPEDAGLTFPGTMGHAAEYARALTAAEILNHYQTGLLLGTAGTGGPPPRAGR